MFKMKLSTKLSVIFACIQVAIIFSQNMDGFSRGETYNNTAPFEGYSIVWGNYLGCYQAGVLKKNPLIKSKIDFKNISVEKCWTFCAKQSFMFDGYSGLQNGKNCLCATETLKLENKLKNCNTKCNGNKSQFCGGKSSLNVYQVRSTAVA